MARIPILGVGDELPEKFLPGRLSEAELSATIARANSLDGSRFVVQGDSLTKAFDANVDDAVPAFRSSWAMHAAVASGGAIRLYRNAGHGGYISSQLRALFDSEVLALNPTLVGLMPGRNDGQDGAVSPDTIAYVTEAVTKCRQRGIGVFIVNTVPQGQAALAAPATVTAEVAHSSIGSVPAGTYRYVVTAGNGPNTGQTGETLASAPVTVTASNAAQTIRVFWDHVPGANWYKVYRETSDGSGVYGLVYTSQPSLSPGFYAGHRYIESSLTTPGAAPPTTNTTALPFSRAIETARLNAWIAQFCNTNNVLLVDVYSDLVDANTGMWKKGYTFDGTHPTGEANLVIGRKVWATLSALMARKPVAITASAQDPLNLYDNGTFASGSATIPTGYNVNTLGQSWELSRTAHERAPKAGFAGNAYTTSASVPLLERSQSPLITSGFSPGDRLLFTFKTQVSLATYGDSFVVQLFNQANTNLCEYRFVHCDLTEPAVVSHEVVVPSGSTGLRFVSDSSGRGPGTVGQFTLYNLTTNSWLDV